MLIAEIGLNHLGYAYQAKEYIKTLANTDVEGITLQVREPEYYVNIPKSEYTLTLEEYTEIADLIKTNNKKIGIAIADINMIDFFESINIDFYKVIRNDMLNDKLIKKLIKTNKKLIISTGTCSEQEISKFIKKYKTDNITLNHTQLSYDIEDCNLLAIQKMKEKYKCDISFGNHCRDLSIIYMALCYKPSDILFYVKGSDAYRRAVYKVDSYPDNEHAIEVDNVKEFIDSITYLKKAIGTGIKQQMEIKIK